jgi:catechol 2,3-dioxygenase-like lactoylglutathione lyase family enzyme
MMIMNLVEPSVLGNETIAAFVACTNAAVARDFYEHVLGLTFVADDQYALVFDAHGTSLRIQKVQQVAPIPYTALGWHVEDIEMTVNELSGRGVNFEQFPGLPQDESGIMTFDNGAKVAWFKDPDGNILSLDQIP